MARSALVLSLSFVVMHAFIPEAEAGNKIDSIRQLVKMIVEKGQESSIKPAEPFIEQAVKGSTQDGQDEILKIAIDSFKIKAPIEQRRSALEPVVQAAVKSPGSGTPTQNIQDYFYQLFKELDQNSLGGGKLASEELTASLVYHGLRLNSQGLTPALSMHESWLVIEEALLAFGKAKKDQSAKVPAVSDFAFGLYLVLKRWDVTIPKLDGTFNEATRKIDHWLRLHFPPELLSQFNFLDERYFVEKWIEPQRVSSVEVLPGLDAVYTATKILMEKSVQEGSDSPMRGLIQASHLDKSLEETLDISLRAIDEGIEPEDLTDEMIGTFLSDPHHRLGGTEPL